MERAGALTWHEGARWGDTIEVDVACSRVGRTSLDVSFEITASGRSCCSVTTTYVYADTDGRPQLVDAETRAALTS